MPPRGQSYLVFDIETVIDPALPQADLGEGFPPAPFHQAVVIGVLWLDADHGARRLGLLAEDGSERDRLVDFTRFVSEQNPTLVSYNGRGFDLPVIVARCLRHGVPFPHYYAGRDLRYRYSPLGHLDVMDFITDFGATRSSKLDIVAKSIGMPGKVGVAGKDVGPLVHAGKIAEVQAYCLCDVVQTAAIHMRLSLIRGLLDEAQYITAMTSLLKMVDEDERLAVLRDCID
jgi:predicted PolB exonuclease-like 3'-5' exonuclease